jgi:hypothetical protein
MALTTSERLILSDLEEKFDYLKSAVVLDNEVYTLYKGELVKIGSRGELIMYFNLKNRVE